MHPHNTQIVLQHRFPLSVCVLLHEWREIKQPKITRVSSGLLNAQDKVTEQSLLDDLTVV